MSDENCYWPAGDCQAADAIRQAALMELVQYIDGLFKSGNDVPVQRAWINDDSWVVIKEMMQDNLPLAHHVIEAECVWRRKKAMYGDEVRAVSPLSAYRSVQLPQSRQSEE